MRLGFGREVAGGWWQTPKRQNCACALPIPRKRNLGSSVFRSVLRLVFRDKYVQRVS
jgi:hypothetical protein